MNRKVRINLLPTELAGKAGKARARRQAAGPAGQGSNPLFVLIAIVAFCASAYGCWTFYAKLKTEKDLHAKTQQELKEIEEKVKETREQFREFIETRDLILALAEVLDAIDPPNRIIWAEKLLMIADLVPEDVFVTSIKVIEKERQVITEESKRAIEAWAKGGSVGPKPEEVRKPIIHQEFTISALARQDVAVEQFTPILAFLKALQNYKRPRQDGTVRPFLENFVEQPKYGDIKATTYDGVGVFQFNIYLVTKPLSAQISVDPAIQGSAASGVIQSTPPPAVEMVVEPAEESVEEPAATEPSESEEE